MTNFELDIVFEMMGSKLAPGSGNRAATCPLAYYTHRNGTDKSKSLMAKAGDPAVFKCWACLSSGTVRTLASKYASYFNNYRALEYVKSVEGDNSDNCSIAGRGRKIPFRNRSKGFLSKLKQEESKYITEEVVQDFCQDIPSYASERGMTTDQILKWEVGFDPVEKRITFPVRDHKGKLFGLTGRDLTGIAKAKWRHYYGTQKEKLFYGEQFWNCNVRRVYIVEGPFDVFNIERLGLRNVFAVMGSQLSFDQMKKIKDWFDEVVFLPDGDQSGHRFCEMQAERIFIQLGKKVFIAGTSLNPQYILQDKMSLSWQATDYRFLLLESFKGRDPADWTLKDLIFAFANVGVLYVGRGGIDAGIEKDFTE